MLRIVFAGTPEFAVPALDALVRSPHSIVGVLTQPDRPAGRGRSLLASPVRQRAVELGIPVAQPPRLATEEQRAPLRQWSPELLVVVAYGLLLPREVLDLPRLGCINIHASLLPRWRGAAPIQRAILAGDAETGVCIMRLEAGLDTGPVYSERRIAIAADATAASLNAQLARLGAEALLPVVDALEAGRAIAQTQATAGVTLARKISKDEARVDWRNSAVQIARQIRAFNPWPVAEAMLAGERVRFWQAHALEQAASGVEPGTVLGLHAGTLHVACGQGTLAIEQLQWPGRRMLPAGECLRGRAHTQWRFT